jgi:hypothetical protein
MAQFNCEICGKGFEQKSRYEQHMNTSHPEQAPSAADLTALLKGVSFPKSKRELLDAIEDKGSEQMEALLDSLPEQQYRDSAEVSRALVTVKAGRSTPSTQPSKEGGRAAMKSHSAASLVTLFSGMHFPADEEQLKEFAKPLAKEEEWEIVNRFGKGKYQDMSDVAKEIGRVNDQ